VVDESLALGVLGAHGRGACEHWGLAPGAVEIVAASMGARARHWMGRQRKPVTVALCATARRWRGRVLRRHGGKDGHARQASAAWT